MQTNKSLSIYRATKDWKGDETVAIVGTYKVWLEENTVDKWIKVEGKGTILTIGKGMVIMEDKIDLTDCYFIMDEKRREIISVNNFTDRKGKFHHSEVTYD